MEIKWEEIITLEGLKQAKSFINSVNGPIGKKRQELSAAKGSDKAIHGKELKQIIDEFDQKLIKVQQQIDNYQAHLRNQKYNDDPFEVNVSFGTNHPLTIVEQRVIAWFSQNGYYTNTTSHIVSDEFNFTRLNIPKNHPARAMQDSLYFDETTLLRTHNTGFSAIELSKNANQAFSYFAIGPVYRNDEDDQTHSHQFTQVDFVSVGDVTFNSLIYTLKSLLSYVMEVPIEIRLRPSFFPFTEPSCEVDMFFENRWIEVLGSGMLHPNVLKAAGYTNDMRAIAAGVGIERLAMIKYKIEDIRDFYTNDLRFLKQFV